MLPASEALFLDQLGSTLSGRSDVVFSRAQTGLTVAASDPQGFDMALLIDDGAYHVSFDEWQEICDDAGVAARLLEDAMTGAVRLRVDTLAGRGWRWTLERLGDDGTWAPHSTISHPTWRIWGRRGVIYRRNSFAIGRQ